MTEHGLPPDSPAGKSVIERYRLGIVGRPMAGDEYLQGMLSIPYLTKGGVKALKFRRMRGEGSKYSQHPGARARLYNVNAFFAAEDVIGVAEGEIDAIVATERLGLPTVAIPGVETWTQHSGIWSAAFKDFSTVLVLADGDPVNEKTGLRPGHELAKKVAESIGWRVRVVQCPEGFDVSSMVAAGRGEELTSKFQLEKASDGDND